MKKHLLTLLAQAVTFFVFSQMHIDVAPANLSAKQSQKKVSLNITFWNQGKDNFLLPKVEPCLPYSEKFLGSKCFLCFTVKNIIHGDTTIIYPASEVIFHQRIIEPRKPFRIRREQEDYLLLPLNSKIRVKYNLPLKELQLRKGDYIIYLEYFSCVGNDSVFSPQDIKIFSNKIRVEIE